MMHATVMNVRMDELQLGDAVVVPGIAVGHESIGIVEALERIGDDVEVRLRGPNNEPIQFGSSEGNLRSIVRMTR